MDAKTIQRRYDLDWLRVLGILFVFIYHSTRFYNVEEWKVKNIVWYPSVEVWNVFATPFMMPLMFAISGASLFYAMGKGGFGKFLKDKVLRLLVPLVVCVFTHASLQEYLNDKTHGLFAGNYFQFLPQYFRLDRIEWTGEHLWYLLFLFLFTIILYPLMSWLKGKGRGFLTKLGGVIAKTGVLYTLMLPPLLLFVLLGPDSPWMEDNGGYPYIVYLWILLLGFLVVSGERVQEKIRQLRWVSLSVGLVMVISFCILYTLADKDTISPGLVLAIVMRVFGGWICVLGFMGLAMQYLTAGSSRLGYANEAVLPFYIFHQTVLLAAGYFVLQWGLPDVLEWMVIVAISFVIIMALYEYAVRRFNVMRFLFGMKPLTKTRVMQSEQDVPVSRKESLPSA